MRCAGHHPPWPPGEQPDDAKPRRDPHARPCDRSSDQAALQAANDNARVALTCRPGPSRQMPPATHTPSSEVSCCGAPGANPGRSARWKSRTRQRGREITRQATGMCTVALPPSRPSSPASWPTGARCVAAPAGRTPTLRAQTRSVERRLARAVTVTLQEGMTYESRVPHSGLGQSRGWDGAVNRSPMPAGRHGRSAMQPRRENARKLAGIQSSSSRRHLLEPCCRLSTRPQSHRGPCHHCSCCAGQSGTGGGGQRMGQHPPNRLLLTPHGNTAHASSSCACGSACITSSHSPEAWLVLAQLLADHGASQLDGSV